MDYRLSVYVPVGERALGLIAPASGIVGSPSLVGLLVDFEGSLGHRLAHPIFAERVEVAAGRHLRRYPTIARAEFPEGELSEVGWFDLSRGVIEVDPDQVDLLCEWLEWERLKPSQLLSHTGPYLRVRELERLFEDLDPAQKKDWAVELSHLPDYRDALVRMGLLDGDLG